MDNAAENLRAENLELWKTHILLRRTGMRDIELLGARRNWIEEVSPGQWQLVIQWRDDWQLVKRGKMRRIGLDSEIVGALIDLPPNAHLVGHGLSPAQRTTLIYRTHSQWLRQFVPPGRHGSNHELRKLAGSEVYMRDGIQAAAYFLGDSVQTTERHYASFLGAIRPLAPEAF
jgi:integrase